MNKTFTPVHLCLRTLALVMVALAAAGWSEVEYGASEEAPSRPAAMPHLAGHKAAADISLAFDRGATWSPDLRVEAPTYSAGTASPFFSVASVGPDGAPHIQLVIN